MCWLTESSKVTKRINSVASAIAWHVSFVFRAALFFGTAGGTFLGYARADSHGGTSTPLLKSNFKVSGFGWCTCRQCHDNWHALGWKIHSRLRRCICIMHVCFRACTSLQPRMLQDAEMQKRVRLLPRLFRRLLYVSVFPCLCQPLRHQRAK